MTAAAALARAHAAGLTLTAVGDRLRWRGPKPAPGLLSELRAHKPELIALLADRERHALAVALLVTAERGAAAVATGLAGDIEAADPHERLAREKGVTYVKLDGNVGILGNGAGLSMSTVDVVVVAGGKPANFCDLGGGGDAQGVVDALEVITSDEQVRSIFFNIFGGITRGDEVARGILAALDQMRIDLPIVVRLDGTNAEEGRRLLAEAAPSNVHVEPTMLEAARRAVELAA